LGFTNIRAEGITENSDVFIDYPSLEMNTDYWWRVKTCADKEGVKCGDWSSIGSFTTFELSTPSNPRPGDGGTLFTYEKYISWDSVPGAKFYQYKVDYEGMEKIPLTIISTNSAYFPSEQSELGQYNWWVQTCLDENCNEVGGLSPAWSFTLVQPSPPAEFGIVPCGRATDNPKTTWNEREVCQFKHIFLMIKIILDFLLWRIGLIILVLLAIATGVIFYFSMGAPTTMARVQSLLKSAGVGYAVILLAWIIINLILKILGVTIEWWILPF